MTPIFTELPRPLGVYTITRLIELRANTALYEAQQTHVDRAVVLEILPPGASHTEEVAFLAQARLRVASSELPHVANVYESLRAEGLWFLTQELPLGRSLADITAAGEQLSVPLICCIIRSAAEMYDLCSQVELQAMPLAPSSIFIEEGGEVHFLSPLVEGESHTNGEQMQPLAQALWPLLTSHKAPGAGRTATLLQWMNEGYEGEFLPWSTVGETASTILEQLAEHARLARERSITYKIAHNPFLQKSAAFIKRWAVHIAVYASIILVLSCMGTFFGMANPVHTSAGNKEAFLCQQNGIKELVLRLPVSIAEYDEFIQAFNNMDEDQRDDLLSEVPDDVENVEPSDWDTQWDNKDPEDPVTGVSYWQAYLYALHAGGNIPSVNQLQAIRNAGTELLEQEWTSSESNNSLRDIYGEHTYLLINNQGQPVPVQNQEYNHAKCGFRICLPDPSED